MLRKLIAIPVAFSLATSAVAANAGRVSAHAQKAEGLAGEAHRYVTPLVIVAIIAAIVFATLHEGDDDETPASP